MAVYQFYQADVFTSEPFAGNAVAVFPRAEGLTTELMQKIARELNLSETTFVTPSSAATRRVRFFTPTSEIPFAGHPTLGTWYVLAGSNEIALERNGVSRVTQETGAGVLPVELVCEEGTVRKVIMTQRPPTFGQTIDHVAELEECLGLPSGTIAGSPTPPQIVSTGLPQAMIPVQSLAALSAAKVRNENLRELLRSYQTDCAMCFSRDTVHPDSFAHCRLFAPGLGVPEDPATGSAAGALGAYLTRYGTAQPDGSGRVSLVFEQGLEIGRPSRIEVEVTTDSSGDPTEIQVSGSCVTVLQGTVRT